jgi:hypothetical protein
MAVRRQFRAQPERAVAADRAGQGGDDTTDQKALTLMLDTSFSNRRTDK